MYACPARWLIATLLTLSSGATLAVSERILRGTVCDQHRSICFNGRIDFDPNAKIIEISGRIIQGSQAGSLQFEFVGLTPLNEQIYHAVTVPLRGLAREIVDHKFGPPLSNQTQWRLLGLRHQTNHKTR